MVASPKNEQASGAARSIGLWFDACNCSILREILAGPPGKTTYSRYTGNGAIKSNNENRITTFFTPRSKSNIDSEVNMCAANELRRLVWNANKEIWMDWRQRPEYLASGDLYSIVILCLFASIILLLMVRAIKPTQSVDDQVTLLLNSMRVRVEFEDNVRQRQKLREAKLKAIRWLAEAKMRANVQKISFRRSRSTASDTGHSADTCFPIVRSAPSPTRSLFAGAFSSRYTGVVKSNSTENDSTPTSFALSSLISQSLSRTPSIIFPIQPITLTDKKHSSSAKSMGSQSVDRDRLRRVAPPSLHLSMHNVSSIASFQSSSNNYSLASSNVDDMKRESGMARSQVGENVSTTVQGYLDLSREDVRRLSLCSSPSSVTPRPPSTPNSVVTAIANISTPPARRILRQEDSCPLLYSSQEQSHMLTCNLANKQEDEDRQTYYSSTLQSRHSINSHNTRHNGHFYYERTRSFHFVPQIVVTPQCDEENDMDDSLQEDIKGVEQQRLLLHQELQAQLEDGGSPLTAIDDDELMDDSSRSSSRSRPFSSDRASSSQSMDDMASQSSFSQTDVILDL